MRAVLLGLLLVLVGLSGPAHTQELFPLQAVPAMVTQNCSPDGTAGGRGMPPNYPYTSDGAATVSWIDCYQVIDGWGADFSFGNTGTATLGGMAGVYSFTNGNGGPGMGLTHMRWTCVNPGTDWWAAASVQCTPTIGSLSCAQAQYVAQLGGKLYFTDLLLGLGLASGTAPPDRAHWPQQASDEVALFQQLNSQCSVPYASMVTNSLQNEGDEAMNYQDYHDFAAALGPAMASAGINVPIAVPETSGFGVSVMQGEAGATMGDPATASLVNVIDWHGYGNVANAPYPYQAPAPGKHGWLTEVSCDATQCAEPALDLFMRTLSWGANLVEYQTGYCPVNYTSNGCFAFDQNGFSTFNGLGYFYGQLSRYIRPGWHLYGATYSPYSDGLVDLLFFRSPTTNDFAIVALNTAATDRTLNVSFQGFTGSTVTPIETTETGDQWAQQAALLASSGFSFALPAQSVTTFIGAGS